MFKPPSVWVAIVVMVACGPAQVTEALPPIPEPAAQPTFPPQPTVRLPGPCEHLMWPLLDGASWQYDLSRGDGATRSMTLRAAAMADAALLTVEDDGSMVESEFRCAPDGLYGALGGLVGHPDLGEAFRLENADGPFLPSPDRLLPLGVDVSWDARYTASGRLTLPLADGPQEATITPGSEVVVYAMAGPVELVETPAGAFNALPVMQSTFFNLQLVSADGSLGVLFGDATSRMYVAEGVGIVRQAFDGATMSGTVEGSPFGLNLEPDVTLTLTSFHLPG